MTKKKDIPGNGAEGRRDLKTKSKVFLKFCGFKIYTAKADGGYRKECQAFLEAMYGERLKPKSYWYKNPRGLPAALLTHILRSSAPDSTTVRPLSEEDVKSVFKKKYLQRKGDAKQTSSGQEIDEASLEKIGLSRGKLIDFFKRMKVAGKGGSETVNVPPPSELVEAPYSSQQGAHAPSIGTTEQGPITVTPEQTQSEIGNRESADSSLASGEDDTARDQDEGDDAGDATDDDFDPDPRDPTYEMTNGWTPTSLDGAKGAAVQEKERSWNPETAIITFLKKQLKKYRELERGEKEFIREFNVTDVPALATGSFDESNTKPYKPTDADLSLSGDGNVDADVILQAVSI